jgi:hypothetical protein
MRFGLYIGSAAGTETGLAIGPQDDPARIHQLLDQLQPPQAPLILRGYIGYSGSGRLSDEAPANLLQYASASRKIDLVVCYRSLSYERDDWVKTLEKIIEAFGKHLYSIQITEEPNLKNAFAGDGQFEHIHKALHDGILAVRKFIDDKQLLAKVGFNTALSFDPADNFWQIIGDEDHIAFRKAIDYVGLDFFPDVFRRIPDAGFPDNLRAAVKHVIREYRNKLSTVGKIPENVPIFITENGWSTGEGRSAGRQCVIIDTIVRAIAEVAEELTVEQYELFGLRDTQSDNPNLFYQFGIATHDYSLKPAFETFRKLIHEFSSQG